MRFILALGVGLFCSCLLVDSLTEKNLDIALVNPADTVRDVFGEIRIAGALALDPEQAEFILNPPFHEFIASFSPKRDTAVLTLTEDLAYATAYRLVLTDHSRIREGEPLRDTLFFRTVEGEREWNNSPATADTLRTGRPLAGSISSRSDTDWFWLLPDFTHDSVLAILDRLSSDLDLDWLDTADLALRAHSDHADLTPETVRVDCSNKPALLRVGTKPNTGTLGRYRISMTRY